MMAHIIGTVFVIWVILGTCFACQSDWYYDRKEIGWKFSKWWLATLLFGPFVWYFVIMYACSQWWEAGVESLNRWLSR